MKTSLIISSLALFILSACSDGANNDLNKAEQAARRDVAKVVDAPAGSMQREKAVIAIRVRENALRQAGYNEAADRYISTAQTLLTDSLRIIQP